MSKRTPYAPGIPDKDDYGNPLEELTPGEVVSLFLQRHSTIRNPKRNHIDMRLGTPETKLFSWAIPKSDFPGPGERRVAPQARLHDFNYGYFEGTLGRTGKMSKVESLLRTNAKITKVTPKSLSFTLSEGDKAGDYTLVKVDSDHGKRTWILLNKKLDEGDEELNKTAAMIKEIDAVPLKIVRRGKPGKLSITALIADTVAKRKRGLSKVAELPENTGMFFTKAGAFWMKDCEMPLDIAFLAQDGTILDKQAMYLSDEPDILKPTYVSRNPKAKYAIEMPLGWFKNNDVTIGDRICIDGS